jgi:hypothetical protein
LDKAQKRKESEEERTEKISQAAQAYKLFSDGKSPVDVAITLNLRQAEVTEFYREYWKLKQQYNLNQVYEEIKGDIGSFLNLYKSAKVAGMNAQHVVKLLAIANNDLPSVEYRCEKLKRQEAYLQAGNHNSARTLQELSDLISTKHGTLKQYELSCKEQGLEITKLQLQKIRLEALVNDYQNNNEGYIKMTRAVEEKVFGVSSDRKALLR